MCTLKYSTNWNQKLCLNIFADIRVYNKNNHFEGNIVDVEYTAKTGIIEFKAEIEKVVPVLLDKVPESMWWLITGYDKENSLKIMHQIYKNTDLDLEKAFFAILILRQRPDLTNTKTA